MFCPECGHRQVSNETRFCSRCGLSMGLITTLANSSDQLKREKRELTGIALIMATVLLLLNFMIVFGVVALPHLANPVFFWIWISFVISSLIVGGLGLANLIRSGFFTKLKERELQLQLMKRQPERQLLAEDAKSASIDAVEMPRLVEQISVTETTTRELEAVPKAKQRNWP